MNCHNLKSRQLNGCTNFFKLCRLFVFHCFLCFRNAKLKTAKIKILFEIIFILNELSCNLIKQYWYSIEN